MAMLCFNFQVNCSSVGSKVVHHCPFTGVLCLLLHVAVETLASLKTLPLIRVCFFHLFVLIKTGWGTNGYFFNLI